MGLSLDLHPKVIHCKFICKRNDISWIGSKNDMVSLSCGHSFASTDICQPEWSYFGGYCYFTSPACASWLTAESNCSAMDSQLVTIHNQDENVYVQHRHNGERSWIELNDRSVEDSFVWTNKEISSFRFWAPHQPNDWNNEDCVHTLGARHGYTWNDVSCNSCFNFTCFTGNNKMPMSLWQGSSIDR